MIICPQCNGKGYIWGISGYSGDYEPDIDRDFCPTCEGKKEIEDIDKDICDICEGKGEIDEDICPACLCHSINTNNGDCYCAECGCKWSM